MSVKIRPYGKGGWEVDIRLRLPDGGVVRERTSILVAHRIEQQGPPQETDKTTAFIRYRLRYVVFEKLR